MQKTVGIEKKNALQQYPEKVCQKLNIEQVSAKNLSELKARLLTKFIAFNICLLLVQSYKIVNFLVLPSQRVHFIICAIGVKKPIK
ncbi:MAG: hypothetical protein IJS81_03795 [Selenomonadaceae bacterium]|nr:hypothetical protein [Selenomonadaceae bacterium]MBQ7629327.1 hypothetical protein [Selenomonadaceae bacterium]